MNAVSYKESPATKSFKHLLRKILKAPVKMVGAMNFYFFGETRICFSDALWYYGTLSFSVIVCLIVCF